MFLHAILPILFNALKHDLIVIFFWLPSCWHAGIVATVRKVTIRISDELFKKLGHYCVDADKSVNQVMTELLEKLLAEAKKTKH